MRVLLSAVFFLFMAAAGMYAGQADSVVPGFEKIRVEESRLRGLCVTKDYVILGVIDSKHSGIGTVYVFDKKGKKVREIAGQSLFFGHGAASDNVSVWTSDYMDGKTIYEYDIRSGDRKGSFTVEAGNPIRIKYDPYGDLLWITCYDIPAVTAYDREGKPRFVYFFEKGGNNASVLPVKNGFYVLFSPANEESNRHLYYYDRNGKLLNKHPVEWGWWDFDIFNGEIYFDNQEGKVCGSRLEKPTGDK